MKTKKYTFQNLFASSFIFKEEDILLEKIEIPIIQRDYAQGRKSDEITRIRDRFLDVLLDSIINNKHITLDFIYGDVSKEGVLTPLDGQQRLTTLFLLHWYTAKKENVEADECKFLKYFSYATRFSSRDFCQELVNYSPDFNKEKLSEIIKDQPWYPYEWKNDPTIQGMLVVIDSIHQRFYDKINLWHSLVREKIISFYFLPLNEMGLTDDLYIKMNSRGKPLTQFEHFKAEFEGIIKQESKELSKEINHKFDIEWTDMLFPFRGDNNIIDDEFMRYFHFISDIICYQSGINSENDEFRIAKLLYSNKNEKAKENIEYLKQSFDCWYGFDIVDFFDKFFSGNTYEKDKVQLYQDDLNIFKECCDNYGEYAGRNRRFPLNKILFLFSINTFLQNKDKISDFEFRRRIRIIRNLIWNSTDEIRDNRMKALLSESKTIILTGDIPVSEKGDLAYNVTQKKEERDKLEWLKTSPQLKDDLFELEDHTLLKGTIAIVGLNNSNNFKKFRLLFDNCNKDLINRALLTFGDYSQLISWRYQIGVKNNESVWSDLFHPTKQRQGFDKTFKIINDLLCNINESEINNDVLLQLIDDFLSNSVTPKDWRYYIVKYSPMRDGKFGMYWWKDLKDKPYEIIMMNTEKSTGGKHWNPFLYTLYKSSVFSERLSLGEYANQGDNLKINNTSIEIKCLNDKYEVTQDDRTIEYPIQQNNAVDIEDRIEKGKEIVEEIFNNITEE